MDIVGKKYIYFAISLLVLIPGIVALALWGLNTSIDFSGGSRIVLSLPKEVNSENIETIKTVFKEENVSISTIQKSGNKLYVRTIPITQEKRTKIVKTLQNKIKSIKQERFETIGPIIGKETTLNVLKALVLASVIIVLYIAWSFRSIPKPASSFRFGICAIIAVLHDVFVVVGIFSILGHFFHVEVDSLFVTALLTIIGFSVHDTIVVFDRIRENLKRMPASSFAEVTNESILQTFTRSLNTSLTTMMVLFTILLFGGESLTWFIVALLIGIASGTYSSIFNAAPLLVVWEEFSLRHSGKRTE